MGDKLKEVSAEYRSALHDLTFNSKPMINVLTMLAEENCDHGMIIVQVICERIKQVEVDKKMPALYLLDSILKNIGGNYVEFISRCIVDIFCHVFESAKDERKRISLFKLRNTWTQYMPVNTLYELDMRSSKTDPNWPVNRPKESVPVNASLNKIHVNPKFLQKTDPANTTGNTASDKNGGENAKNSPRSPKERLLEEEKRVQEQLKAIQAEKIKRDREEHDITLRKKQQERERLLADQKRQLGLLRKQQQSMTNNTTSKDQPLHINTSMNNHPVKKAPTKDPRLRVTPPSSQEIRTGKWGEKLTSPTFSSKISPKPTHKKNKGAVSVMNKIMGNLSAKKGKQEKHQKSASKPTTPTSDSPGSSNNSSKDSSPKLSPKLSTSATVQEKKNVIAVSNQQPTEPVTSKSTIKIKESITPENQSASKVADKPVEEGTSSITTSPFSAAFSGLSNRDMQIAAQAAAIATAMHQMQSVNQGPIAPEQSAQLAAQFIKLMQGVSTAPSVAPVNVTSTVEASETTSVSTTDVSIVKSHTSTKSTADTSKEISSEINKATYVVVEKPEKPAVSDKTETKKVNTERHEQATFDKDRFGRDKTRTKTEVRTEEKVRDRSPIDSKKVKPSLPTNITKDKIEKEKEKSTENLNKSKEKGRGREWTKTDSEKLEPPTKKSKEVVTDHTERSRKARARSPSRYYCRIERKVESEKRIEKKEKELKLQRIRKESEGEAETTTKTENVSENKSKPPTRDQMKVFRQFMGHITELEKRHKKPNSTIKVTTLENVYKQVQSKFKAGLLTGEHNNNITKRINGFASHIAGREIKMNSKNNMNTKKVPNPDTEKIPKKPSPMKRIPKIDRNSPVPPGEQHQREGPDPRFDPGPPGMPPHMIDSQHSDFVEGQHIEDGPPNLRNGPRQWGPPGPGMHNGPMPSHMRDRPPHRRDSPMPPHMMNGPPQHMMDGPPQHMMDGPPQHMMDGPPQHKRDGPPQHKRDGPPQHMRDGPPQHMRDGPPQHMRDGPPQHMRDGPPQHMRDGPPQHMRDGPPPQHMRDGPPPQHMMDGPPPHMRDGPPRHMMDGPPQHMRDGPPPHMRDGPPRHMMDGPPRHMMDGPPRHMMDGPPRHMMDGPPRRMMDSPPHHMMDGPPKHMRDGPQQNIMDGPPQHMMDNPPQHMMDGPPPQHLMDGPPQHRMDGSPQQTRDGPPHHVREGPMYHDGPPMQHIGDGIPPLNYRDGPAPPHMRSTPPPPHIMDEQMNRDGPPNFKPLLRPPDNFNENSSDRSQFFHGSNSSQGVAFPNAIQGPSLDVNNLLGQLMAAGMINKNKAEEEAEEMDSNVPEMPLKMEELKKRHAIVVNQLFLGLQCSSCGERFPTSQKKQYSDHLDWHFRENRREKDGIKKVASRSWYHDILDWVELSEKIVGDDGKVQSQFFEAVKSDKPSDVEEVKFSMDKRKEPEEELSIPVAGDEGHGICGVCMDPLEQYWDEDLEEWRFKKAVREGNKTYHINCFKDYVPCEIEEATSPTPVTTPISPDIEQPAFPKLTSDDKNNEVPKIKTEMDDNIVREPESRENHELSETSNVESMKDQVIIKSEPINDNNNELNTNGNITVKTEGKEIKNLSENLPASKTNVELQEENRLKEEPIDDEFIDNADSPEYPLILSTTSDTNSAVAIDTHTNILVDGAVTNAHIVCNIGSS